MGAPGRRLHPRGDRSPSAPIGGLRRQMGKWARRSILSFRAGRLLPRSPACERPGAGSRSSRPRSVSPKIVRHERGYRAEYAYPAELIVAEVATGFDAEEVTAELASAYGVPARVEIPYEKLQRHPS